MKNTLRNTVWNFKNELAVLVVFLLLPVVFTAGYQLRILSLIIIFAMFTYGLNIVFGHTDQLYLFVGGIAGIGGYVSVILSADYGISPWITLIIATLVCGALTFGISYIAARRNLTTILIAILTLALSFALVEFFVGARNITGGSTGMMVSSMITDSTMFYYFLIATLIAYMLIYRVIIDSHIGLAFKTIRDDEVAARVVGVDVVWYKSLAGFVAGAMIGFTGVLYVNLEGFILPGMFTFETIDFLVLIMVVLGGMRTQLGPIVGAAITYTVHEQILALGELSLVVFGAALIALFLFFRQGIVPAMVSYSAKIDWEQYGGRLTAR